MYETFFAFSERPFSIAPDPRFLYLSERHREALAHLVYGLNDAGGFVMLTGEVGTGKTTLCRSLLAQVPPSVDVAFVLNPRLDAVELLETVCDELHIDTTGARGSIKQLVDRINAHLLARNADGRSTVLLIDEAQNLSTDVLEQLRLLTNLETNERKLLRIILIGQPELADKLARPDLRQLAQRITARYHLEALQAPDTAAYVEHRLQVAGARATLFGAAALRALHQCSGGVPRLINVIADRALLGAYAGGRREVTPEMVRKAATEVTGHTPGRRWPAWAVAATTTGVLGACALAAWALVLRPPASTEAAPPASAAQVVAVPPVTAADPGARDVFGPVPAADGSMAFANDEPLIIGPPGGSATPDAAFSTGGGGASVIVRTQLPPWPDYVPRDESEDRAFAILFDRWRSPFDAMEGEAPCVYARKVGLACLRGMGTLDEVLDIDRPAVLELSTEGGVYAAALVAVQDDTVDLVIADRTYRLPRAVLDASWGGRYTLLWQLPPEYRGPIGPGARGASVAWLRQQLQDATGVPVAGTAQDAFDAALTAALRGWQSSQGLQADGRAGPRTWIALHDAAGLAAPRLQDAAVRTPRAAARATTLPAQRPAPAQRPTTLRAAPAPTAVPAAAVRPAARSTPAITEPSGRIVIETADDAVRIAPGANLGGAAG